MVTKQPLCIIAYSKHSGKLALSDHFSHAEITRGDRLHQMSRSQFVDYLQYRERVRWDVLRLSGATHSCYIKYFSFPSPAAHTEH